MHHVKKGIFLVAIGALVGVPLFAQTNGGTHEYRSVNGARLYVESFGHGTPLVFLHGGLMFFDNAYACAASGVDRVHPLEEHRRCHRR
jgi:pimeloyl-ACP methyl ester carboxylesterase